MKKIFSVFDKKDWAFCFIAIFSVAIGSVFDVLSPFFYAKIMNIISAQQGLGQLTWTSDMKLYFGLMLSFPFITILLTLNGVWFATKASIIVTTKLRSLLYNKSLYLSSSDLDRITGASIVTRTTGDIVQILNFLVMFFSTFVKAISLIIGGFTLSIIQLATFDGEKNIWFLAMTYLLFPILIGILSIIITKGLPLFKQTRIAIDQNNTIMEENILGNRLVRAFNLQKAQSLRYEQGNETLRVRNIKSDRVLVIILPIITLIMNLAAVLIFLFAGVYSLKADVNQSSKTIQLVGVVQAFISYFLQMLVGLSLLGMVAFNFTRAKSCVLRIYEVIDTINPIVSGSNSSLVQKGDIEFKNVSFKYNDNDSKNVLSNISFKIKNGETLGILGQTGSGKSSLVNLILRLYDVNDGEILIDGINIKDYDLNHLRNDITMALQEKVLIRGTVRSNILIGNQNATHDQIIAAAKDAQAFDFINKLQDKFDALVDQKGKNFSGGQQQRISIARALIKKAKILIFDDSTSALDNITESKLLKNLKEKYNDRTKIIISQKIRTIKDADHIIVLKNGKIDEQGRHHELLKLKGLYKSIYDSQESSMEK